MDHEVGTWMLWSLRAIAILVTAAGVWLTWASWTIDP